MVTLAYNSSVMEYLIQQEMRMYITRMNKTFSYLQILVLVTGLLGNLLALIVINQKSLRNTSSAVFITYMALFDTAVLFAHTGQIYRPRRNLFIHCSLTYLQDLCTFCANWILVIVTLERCVAVSSPFLAKRFCTVESARRFVLLLSTFGLILSSIYFPLVFYPERTVKKKCYVREHYHQFHRIFQLTLFYGVPDLLLLSNIFTIFTLCRRRRRQERLSANQNAPLEMRVNDVHSNRKQRQLTLMLVTVNVVFYSFSTPAIISFFSEISPSDNMNMEKRKWQYLVGQLTVIFVQIPNATNFIFYCLAGARFRQATVETFEHCRNYCQIFFHRYLLCQKHYQLAERIQSATYRSSNTSAANAKKTLSKAPPSSRNRSTTF